MTATDLGKQLSLRELLQLSLSEMMYTQATIDRIIDNVLTQRDYGLSSDLSLELRSALSSSLVAQLSPDSVISLTEAARELGIHYRTLRAHIKNGTGPEAIKLTNKLIGIRRSALNQWLDARKETLA